MKIILFCTFYILIFSKPCLAQSDTASLSRFSLMAGFLSVNAQHNILPDLSVGLELGHGGSTRNFINDTFTAKTDALYLGINAIYYIFKLGAKTSLGIRASQTLQNTWVRATPANKINLQSFNTNLGPILNYQFTVRSSFLTGLQRQWQYADGMKTQARWGGFLRYQLRFYKQSP